MIAVVLNVGTACMDRLADQKLQVYELQYVNVTSGMSPDNIASNVTLMRPTLQGIGTCISLECGIACENNKSLHLKLIMAAIQLAKMLQGSI